LISIAENKPIIILQTLLVARVLSDVAQSILFEIKAFVVIGCILRLCLLMMKDRFPLEEALQVCRLFSFGQLLDDLMKATLDLLDLIQSPNMMGRQRSRRSLRKLHMLYHCLVFSIVFHRF